MNSTTEKTFMHIVVDKMQELVKSGLKLSLLGILIWMLRAYYKFRKSIEDSKRSGIPMALGDERITPLGFISAISKNYDKLYDFRKENYERASKKLGRDVKSVTYIAPFWMGCQIVGTKDPLVVKHILKDNFENYLKSGVLRDVLFELIGDGIFRVNHGKFSDDKGEAWTFQRKTASKIFTRNLFKGHVYETLMKNCTKITSSINRSLDAKENIIPMQAQFFRFTLDSIGDIGFGVDLKTLNAGFNDQVEFATAFDTAQFLLAKRPLNIGYKLFKNLYKSEREISRCLSILNSFCDSIIDERLNMPESDLEKLGDILSLFLQSIDRKAQGSNLKKFLRDIVMSFFIAGRDTTACTLTFVFYSLSLPENKYIQDNLHKEIVETLKMHKVDKISLEILEEMPILHGVVFEALRLFPPVPFDGKEAVKDDVLPGGHVITGGTKIGWDAYAMGRDPTRYENPLQFKPDRWVENGNQLKGYDQYEFPMFQAGPRICLGKDLAVFEAKLCVSELIENFEFDFAENMTGKEIIYKPGITLTFNGNLDLKVTRRK